MTTRRVTLARLEQIARDAGARVAVDATRGIAYLRRGQTVYQAPLAHAG